MPGPAKITLGAARDCGAVGVIFYCHNIAAGCTRSGALPMAAAIARWGDGLRLDQIPARCVGCDSRAFVDVRPDYPAQADHGALDALIREAWRR